MGNIKGRTDIKAFVIVLHIGLWLSTSQVICSQLKL